jgi:two-component system LytT family response regulator
MRTEDTFRTMMLGGLSIDRLKPIGLGFVYWGAILIALEPGNLDRAIRDGYQLALDREVIRILAAASLGAAVTPLLLAIAKWFPLTAASYPRSGLAYLVSVAVLSFILNVVSCFLASWLFAGEALPPLDTIREQLAGNWVLLVLIMFMFMVVTQLRDLLGATRQVDSPKQEYLSQIAVKDRGRTHFVTVDDVDWIETQGNYLALHVGTRAHLVRATAEQFASKLDPARFVRIHRCAIVRIERVQEIRPLTNGDALLTLANGVEVRASRRYREAVQRACAARRDEVARP